MHAVLPLPPATPPGAEPAATNPTRKVVIVYDDLAAGDRAVRVLTQLKAQLQFGHALCPTPWKFEYLAELPWRLRALRDMQAADIVILALSHPDDVPAPINRWFKACLDKKRGQRASLYVAFGSDDIWTLSLESAETPAMEPSFAPAGAERDYAFFPFARPLPQPTPFY